MGGDAATAIQLTGEAATFEVTCAEDWATLCRAFPLEVTASRRHDWYRVTGRAGVWVVPDWARVAGRWDAVHLSVAGYLSAATRIIDVEPDVASMIAGWSPDTTVWLADVLVAAAPQHWESWTRTSCEGPWARLVCGARG